MNEQATVIGRLAGRYPLLYLNPDRDDVETYRAVVLRGEDPGKRDLSHFTLDPRDREETFDTPSGPVEVVTLWNRADYETFVRGMMAARKGPLAAVPPTEGASTLAVFNWGKIKAHQARFLREEREKGVTDPDWGAEFARFTAEKSNYLDLLIVLSRGPYSHIDAATAGYGEDEWIALSDTIRKYHELNHVICRRLYPERIHAVWDELAADATGLYAAFGRFDPGMEKLFLGIRGEKYTGGRLENYTKTPDEQAKVICEVLEELRDIIGKQQGTGPFELTLTLVKRAEEEPLRGLIGQLDRGPSFHGGQPK